MKTYKRRLETPLKTYGSIQAINWLLNSHSLRYKDKVNNPRVKGRISIYFDGNM